MSTRVSHPTPVRSTKPGVAKAVKPTAPKPAAKKVVAKAAPAVAQIKRAPNVAAPAVAAKAAGKPRLKPVRDSFTMPQQDFALVGVLKKRALAFRRPAKKSELLRAGLHALQALDDNALKAALNGLTPLKAGRPKKAD